MAHVAFNVEDPPDGKIRLTKLSDTRFKASLGIILASNDYSVTFDVPLAHTATLKSPPLETEFAKISDVVLKEIDEHNSSLTFLISTKQIDGSFEQILTFAGTSEQDAHKIVIDFAIIEDRFGHPFIREGIKDLSHNHPKSRKQTTSSDSE